MACSSSTCGDTTLHAHFVACLVHVLSGLGFMGELRVGGRRREGEDAAGDDSFSESMAASLDSGASSGSLCSSIMSSLTDDDAESSPVAGDPTPSPSPSDAMRLDGDGGGPLYELAPLLAHLPVRAVQVLQREVPVLHISVRRQMLARSRKEDHRPHRQEGEPLVDFTASRSRASQQDDREEEEGTAQGFIWPAAVKSSMEQGPFAQKR
ncbi:uncharacterized protein LOC125521415 isoform X2 [Triticum urartu]|uniref:uncharacterized protein LOC125521415 isoform X2 n=1 Tax=Triticum urartu TaxID=4572 RepID=UPI002043789D|nr:uncharacterized protein LOC125521415 isoform X2 [Triticum urartu]